MSRSTEEILTVALFHFEIVEEYAARDTSDQLVLDGISMRLSSGIDALSNLEATERDRLLGEEWPLMWGMRNRIAHGYIAVDADIIRATAERRVPVLVERIRGALAD
ncbi:HepT-like ribonuclease domain-containing protein [Mariniluteicoccus flavus]